MIEPFRLDSSRNRISGVMTFPECSPVCPCVILSHGLVSSKESSKYIAISDRFAEAGMATCRFDYHGCGESGGRIEETSLTIRIGNLAAVVEHVLSHPLVDHKRVGMLGSSFGGTVCIVKAAADKRIKCLSSWATPYLLERPANGVISDIRFKETLYSDFQAYEILGEAAKVSTVLVIHGELDEVVPATEGRAIYDRMKEPKQLSIIEEADHVFSNSAHRGKAIHLALDWFKTWLEAG
jgi:uncharacterized protein